MLQTARLIHNSQHTAPWPTHVRTHARNPYFHTCVDENNIGPKIDCDKYEGNHELWDNDVVRLQVPGQYKANNIVGTAVCIKWPRTYTQGIRLAVSSVNRCTATDQDKDTGKGADKGRIRGVACT